MLIKEELELRNFKFWGGAKGFAELLTPFEFGAIEKALEEIYPDGIEDVKLNDIFWFDQEFISEIIGRDPWEEEADLGIELVEE